jgi:gluconate 5-dehydrogenase
MSAGAFKDQLVVVTGGGRGLGLAISRGFVAAGAQVAIIGRDASRLNEAAAELTATGPGAAHPFSADVADEGAMTELASELMSRLGTPDVLINNAGINPWYKRAQHTSMAEWRQIVDVNLTAVFHCCLLFGVPMLECGRGSIINISSVAGHVGLARSAAYNATKGGLELLTKSLAIDWAEHRVRVNTVAPGYLETDLTSGLQDNPGHAGKIVSHTPLGRFGTPEEIVGACLYLASGAASYVTGQCIRVDGGFSAC